MNDKTNKMKTQPKNKDLKYVKNAQMYVKVSKDIMIPVRISNTNKIIDTKTEKVQILQSLDSEGTVMVESGQILKSLFDEIDEKLESVREF